MALDYGINQDTTVLCMIKPDLHTCNFAKRKVRKKKYNRQMKKSCDVMKTTEHAVEQVGETNILMKDKLAIGCSDEILHLNAPTFSIFCFSCKYYEE